MRTAGTLNGGVIGKKNESSRGLDGLTPVQATTPTYITNTGTRVVSVTAVAGGGAGGGNAGGGGGGGGMVLHPGTAVCGGTTYPITVGGGGAAAGGSNKGGTGSDTTGF